MAFRSSSLRRLPAISSRQSAAAGRLARLALAEVLAEAPQEVLGVGLEVGLVLGVARRLAQLEPRGWIRTSS